jgi:Predicted transcriptional regulators
MLTIGSLARRVGIRTSAIRYYEAQRILPPPERLPSGYRVYKEEALASLHFVCRAKALGFTLAEIKQFLELARRGQLPCSCVRELAHHHVGEINAKIRELATLRRRLRALLRCTPARGRTGKICSMIELECEV